MKKVNVKTSKGVITADLIRENHHTIIVRLSDGNEIKRHKRKHLA